MGATGIAAALALGAALSQAAAAPTGEKVAPNAGREAPSDPPPADAR